MNISIFRDLINKEKCSNTRTPAAAFTTEEILHDLLMSIPIEQLQYINAIPGEGVVVLGIRIFFCPEVKSGILWGY